MILGIFTFHGINGTSYYIISILLYFIFTKTKEGKRYTLIKSSFISGLLFILFRFLSIIIIGKIVLFYHKALSIINSTDEERKLL